MMLIKILLVFFWMAAVPALAGFFLLRCRDYRVGEPLMAGYLVSYASAEILTVLFTYLKAPLHLLSLVYGLLMGLLAVLGIIKLVKRERERRSSGEPVPALRTFLKENLSVWLILAAVFILVQVVIVFVYGNVDADDSFFVAMATGSVRTDTVFQVNPYTGGLLKSLPKRYVYAQYPTLLAVMSQLTAGLHPAILAHTFYPVILLPFAYLMLYRCGALLFDKSREGRGIFLLFAAFLGWFSGFSQKNAMNMMMIRLWQGKAALAGLWIPLLFYLCFTIMLEEKPRHPWYFLLFGCLGACLLSSLAVVLAPLVLGSFGIICLIRFRKPGRVLLYVISALPCIAVGILYLR